MKNILKTLLITPWDVEMPCPLYTPPFRECKNTSPQIILDVPEDFCRSEEYAACPFYKIIYEKKPFCEYAEECVARFHKLQAIVPSDSEVYNKVLRLIFDYCFSDNMENCARLPFKKNGEIAPNDLLQDGSRLKFRDLLKDLSR